MLTKTGIFHVKYLQKGITLTVLHDTVNFLCAFKLANTNNVPTSFTTVCSWNFTCTALHYKYMSQLLHCTHMYSLKFKNANERERERERAN